MTTRTRPGRIFTLRPTSQGVRSLLAGGVLLSVMTTSGSAVLSLADAPLGSGPAPGTIKPNIAMVIDDSGSMAFPNMPGDIDASDSTTVAAANAANITRYGRPTTPWPTTPPSPTRHLTTPRPRPTPTATVSSPTPASPQRCTTATLPATQQIPTTATPTLW